MIDAQCGPLENEMAESLGSRSLAVLIDADNTSPRYATAIFEEIATLGEAHVRRIYGDFADARLSGWDIAVQSFAILQHQQRSNTRGKNSSDIALVIDAMDLMYKGRFDGFCIASSDSDFTRLSQRLREDGLAVYGFGERKTPETFRNACTRFIYVENLVEPMEPLAASDDCKPGPEVTSLKEPATKAVPIIRQAIAALESEDGWVALSAVGHRIANISPDFDPRTFGHSKLSTLVEKTGGFEIARTADKHVKIRLRSPVKNNADKGSAQG